MQLPQSVTSTKVMTSSQDSYLQLRHPHQQYNAIELSVAMTIIIYIHIYVYAKCKLLIYAHDPYEVVMVNRKRQIRFLLFIHVTPLDKKQFSNVITRTHCHSGKREKPAWQVQEQIRDNRHAEHGLERPLSSHILMRTLGSPRKAAKDHEITCQEKKEKRTISDCAGEIFGPTGEIGVTLRIKVKTEIPTRIVLKDTKLLEYGEIMRMWFRGLELGHIFEKL